MTMAIWTGLLAIALGLAAIVSMEPNVAAILRSVLELSAVLGVFALVCAAEARN
jgi:hypothetical protein